MIDLEKLNRQKTGGLPPKNGAESFVSALKHKGYKDL